MKARVLFCNPPWWVRPLGPDEAGEAGFRWVGGVRAGSRWPFTFRMRSAPGEPGPRDYAPYPFFLGYAATWAEARGAEVSFRDSVALRESYASFYSFADGARPDFVVLESASPSWEHDRGVIAELVRRLPGVRVVVTGPIATLGEAILAQAPVHAVVQGEYEKGVVKVLEGASGVLAHDLLTLEEMNSAPFPYYDDAIAHAYFDGHPRGQLFPHAQVWSSRGCPFKCIFCVWPATMTGNDPDGEGTRTVRHYSAEYVEEMLTRLRDRWAFRSIYFDDDTFNLGNAHVLRMCDVMRRVGLPWSAMCRADTVRMETWRDMREAGCFGVKLGFESGSQYVNDAIVNKHLDLEQARRVVHEVKRLGMSVHGTFTYGLPGETPEQMLETRAFVESLPFDSVQQSGTAEIEGTPLATLSRTGRLPRYSGAAPDSSYDRQQDGNVKFQLLVKKLQLS